MKRLLLERTDINRLHDMGLLIVCGGQSTRMGRDKAALPWQEGTLLTSLMIRARSFAFSHIVIAGNQPVDLRTLPGELYAMHPLSDRSGRVRLTEEELTAVEPHQIHRLEWVVEEERTLSIYLTADQGEPCGPLGGLAAGLSEGPCDAYLAVSVDMPLFDNFDFGDVTKLRTRLGQKAVECIVPTINGRLEPLGALYSTRCLPVIIKLLRKGERRLRAIYDHCDTEYVDVTDKAYAYKNINTYNEYKAIRALFYNSTRKKPVISVVAKQSKTGKTEVSTRLIDALQKLGYEVGYVKSDGHGFTMDTEGTDTWKADKAGAKAVAIAGPEGYAILSHTGQKTDLMTLAEQLPVDIAVLETRSRGVEPIIEVVTDYPADFENCITPVDNLLSVVYMNGNSDTEYLKVDNESVAASESSEASSKQNSQAVNGVAVYSLADIESLAKWLVTEVFFN